MSELDFEDQVQCEVETTGKTIGVSYEEIEKVEEKVDDDDEGALVVVKEEEARAAAVKITLKASTLEAKTVLAKSPFDKSPFVKNPFVMCALMKFVKRNDYGLDTMR